MKVLVNFLSEQVMQNYIPIRKLNPDLVLALATEKFQGKTIHFEKVTGIKHKELSYTAFDLEENQRILDELLAEYKDDEVFINFTGGTKLMIVPCFTGNFSGDIKFVYADTTNELLVIYNRDNAGNYSVEERKSFDLKIPFKHYFELIDEEIKDDYNETMTPGMVTRKDTARNFAENNVYKNYTIGEKGDLFEEYIFNRLSSHKNKLFDNIVHNIILRRNKNTRFKKGQKSHEGDKNELDFFISKGAKSAIIECKSGEVTQNHITKLNSLKCRLLGSYGNAAIVSRFGSKDPGLYEKAEDYGIELLSVEKHKESLHKEIAGLLR